jgi:general secretion pathway protein K
MTAAANFKEERGFALLAVTLVLALLGVVVSEFAFSMRLQAAMVRAYKDAVLARHLAEAGLQQAIREVLNDAAVHGLDDDGQVVFYQVAGSGATPKRLPELPRSRVKLGMGEFSYRITDEEARLNVNSGMPARLDQLLNALGVDKTVRDTITDSVEDWRDANDTHRANGAESDDYLKLPVPYRARNANLQDVAELLQIKGVTPELYQGQGDQPGLVDLVTVRSRGTVNVNTAPKLVLRAMGLSDAAIDDVMQSRASVPYPSVPARYQGLRFTVGSATFRIEATGFIGGEPRARLVAIVQRTVGAQTGASPALAVYSWRTLPPALPSKEPEGAAKTS